MSYMKLKQLALVMMLMVFGAQCVKAVDQTPCLTIANAKKQALTADQQTKLLKYVGEVFNDPKSTVNWACLAKGVSYFITEQKQTILKHPHLAQLAAALLKTTDYTSSLSIAYELQGFRDVLSDGSTEGSTNQILTTLGKKITLAPTPNCKDELTNRLYSIAHPTLCKTVDSKSDESTKYQQNMDEMRKKAESLLSDDDEEL